jgi:hypothetical protein
MSDSIDLRNALISALYIIFGTISSIVIFFVMLIHFKYPKFRENIYSVILGCLVCEYILCLHAFWTGFRALIFGFLQEVTVGCAINAIIVDFAFNSLLSYNICLVLMLFCNKLPNNYTRKKNKNYEEDSFIEKYAYQVIHIVSISMGLIHAIVFTYSQSYGFNSFGSCFVKNDLESISYFLAIPLIIYTLCSFIFLVVNCKKKYYTKFPPLKKFSFYLVLTTLCCFWQYIAYMTKLTAGGNIFSSLDISAFLFSLVIFCYVRLCIGYIQTVLKQGDSSNRMIQAILIFFCLETKVDVEAYDHRTSMKLKALSKDVNIN